MTSVKRVTVTRTVFLGEGATDSPLPAAPTQAVTVIYVTRTREPKTTTTTTVATPTACSNYVCPGDCEDWSCYEASFIGGSNGADNGNRNGQGATDEACSSFVQCIQYKCSRNEPFSFDLSREFSLVFC
jgi:hypothetical protein